ncbi:myocardin-related transcription factor B isoform X3 [Scophthalmus maximus]|uniref:myocardin-related transcription factor B isoform X3 n=1 Tax=Scophthalmus maximus TaxID=52904 RepID=UPI001FA940B6|nr:myocardin-related transcription factor B isoform X3 [Scophthalmus maximus]
MMHMPCGCGICSLLPPGLSKYCSHSRHCCERWRKEMSVIRVLHWPHHSMGLQTWPPSEPALSSMACLDVETPSICRVLQLCLQQRRTREQLVEQGIMPPLKTPAAFHEQIRSLERAKTGNFLKHKLCSRPERSELVRMHILQVSSSESQAEACLQATQMKLKRARLTDDLNEKIAHRPGAMELVEKNILPVDSAAEEVIDGSKANYSKAPDVYSFDEEDSSEALSPEQPSSQETPSSTSTSLRETEATAPSSQLNSPVQHSPPSNSQSTSDFVTLVPVNEQHSSPQACPPQPIATVVPSIHAGPVLVKQSLPKQPGDKSRGKKGKEAKPWVKKLKYHQYIPPDQKQELNELPMDSTYARLLQQQQQFLQLQILSQQQQQQQQYNYPAVLPATVKPTTEVQTSCCSGLSGNAASVPAQPRRIQRTRKLDHLPANLDEMKVAELKLELKRRSLPVSGTKTDLIERLKVYQETSTIQTAAAAAVETTASQCENIRFTPPVSPVASKVSSLGIEDSGMADSPANLSDALSPTSMSSPQRAPQEELPTETWSLGKDSEKDKRLHEKERQIEELMRKLEQEQRLVEELKMQLEVEKRSQQGDSPPRLSPLAPVQVKEENGSPSNCSTPCSFPSQPALVKQEEEAAADPSHFAPPNQFISSHRTIKQPEALQSVQAGVQILLPASLPASAVAAIQLPANCLKLHTAVSGGTGPGLVQTSGQVPQKTEASAALQQNCSAHSPPLAKTWTMDTAAHGLLGTFPASGCPAGPAANKPIPNGPNKSPTAPPIVLQTTFTNHVSKCKDPPRYEDAVKQTRSMITAVQGPTAASQQMDDLFDVLIESGEISPFIKHDHPSQDKPLPVTASVTTLPVNMVLSRPPPVVQVAQVPTAPLEPSPGVAALDSLLDCTLGTDAGPQTLKLIEELHSPIVAMDVDFTDNTPPSAFSMHSANMDNMDWLDLTLSVPAEGVNPLDMSVTSVGVFSSDFLDADELC